MSNKKISIIILIIFILAIATLLIINPNNNTTVSTTPKNSDDIKINTDEIKCLPEQRDVEECIEIYKPVCATVNIQCVTAPCDTVKETFENSCKACSNSLVNKYTNGECINSQ